MNESDNNTKDQKAKFSRLAIASFVLAVIPFAFLILAMLRFEMETFLEAVAYIFTNKLLFSYNKVFVWVYLFIGWPGSFIFSVTSIVFSVWGIHKIVKSKGSLRGTVFAELGLSMASIVLWFYIYTLSFWLYDFPVPE